MNEKLRHLREHMDESVLMNVDFSESSKEKVRKAVRAQSGHPSRQPWIYQLKNGLSVAACLLLLFGGVVYAIHEQESTTRIGGSAQSNSAQKSSESTATAKSKKFGAVTMKDNGVSQSKEKAPANKDGSTYLIRIMNGGIGWKLTKKDVMKTADSGRHWSSVKNIKGNPLLGSSGFFLNPYDAWITTINHDGTSTQYHTLDGGQTWIPSSSNVPAEGWYDFINKYDGWILHKSGEYKGNDQVELYKTINSGDTWEMVAITGKQLPTTGKMTGIGFARVPLGLGWLSGYDPHSPGHPWLYKTINGGEKWVRDSIPLNPEWKKDLIKTYPPMFFTGGTMLPMTMADRDTGELKGMIFYRHDKRAKWTPLKAMHIQSSQVIYDFINISTGWVITDDAVYKTNNGGMSWDQVKAGHLLTKTMANGDAQELDMTSDQTARLLVKMKDGKMRILMTTDGGITWE